MNKMMIPFAGIGLLLLILTDAAIAAPPAYCALFARETAKEVAAGRADGSFERTLDQAYYKCLNMDEEPALPADSAYVDGEIVEPDLPVSESTDVAVSQEDVDLPDDTLTAPMAEGDTDLVEAAESGEPPRSRSGLTAWSPEWKAWCEEHFPNSFNPETGMVLPLEGGKSFC